MAPELINVEPFLLVTAARYEESRSRRRGQSRGRETASRMRTHGGHPVSVSCPSILLSLRLQRRNRALARRSNYFLPLSLADLRAL